MHMHHHDASEKLGTVSFPVSCTPDSQKPFERGVALTRQCQASLQAAQQKVEILLKRGAKAEIEPFEEPADEANEAAARPAAPE